MLPPKAKLGLFPHSLPESLHAEVYPLFHPGDSPLLPPVSFPTYIHWRVLEQTHRCLAPQLGEREICQLLTQDIPHPEFGEPAGESWWVLPQPLQRTAQKIHDDLGQKSPPE